VKKFVVFFPATRSSLEECHVNFLQIRTISRPKMM